MLDRLAPAVFVFLWSTGWIAAGYAAIHSEPFTFLAWRYGLSFLAFAALCIVAGARWPRDWRQALKAVYSGIFLHGLYLAGLWWAVARGVSAGLSGIIAIILIVPLVKPWFSEAQALPTQAEDTASPAAGTSLWARTPVMLAIATAFAGLSIYGYLGLYPTYLREALGFSPKQAAGAVSFYGLGALLSLLGGWLGDRYDYRKLLFGSLLLSALAGGLLFTDLEKSLSAHAAMSFIFGAAISGMVYANLSAGIIKSVSRAKAAQASGLFVASLYVPAAFAGYLLGQLKLTLGWTQAGILQVTGCAILAALFSIAAGVRRPDPIPTTTTSAP